MLISMGERSGPGIMSGGPLQGVSVNSVMHIVKRYSILPVCVNVSLRIIKQSIMRMLKPTL